MKTTSHNVHPRPRGSLFGRVLLVPAFAGFVGLAVAAPSCATPENRTIILGGTPDAATAPPSFTTEDAGQTAPAPQNLTEYCPTCATVCRQGWADCNGDPSDGCEVNLGSDQQNCGECGRACDALAGQPCVAGQCAVHPCGEGEEAR